MTLTRDNIRDMLQAGRVQYAPRRGRWRTIVMTRENHHGRPGGERGRVFFAYADREKRGNVERPVLNSITDADYLPDGRLNPEYFREKPANWGLL